MGAQSAHDRRSEAKPGWGAQKNQQRLSGELDCSDDKGFLRQNQDECTRQVSTQTDLAPEPFLTLRAT